MAASTTFAPFLPNSLNPLDLSLRRTAAYSNLSSWGRACRPTKSSTKESLRFDPYYSPNTSPDISPSSSRRSSISSRGSLTPENTRSRRASINIPYSHPVMESRTRRGSPPNGRMHPSGRSSNSSFDDYDDGYYSRTAREYKDPYGAYGPYGLSKSSTFDSSYAAARPRRGTLTKDNPVTDSSAQSPPRHDKDDRQGKTHKKTYSIGEGGTKLIDERFVSRDEYETPRERRYHTAASYNRPIGDEDYSYTDAAGMYRDTEPKSRPRRGSVDRGSEHNKYYSRDEGNSYTSRLLERLHDNQARRDAYSGRNPRSSTMDTYLAPPSYDRRSRPTSIHALPTGDMYSRSFDNHDHDHRRSRSHYRDTEVESRGFGIRSQSTVRPASISPDKKISVPASEAPRPVSTIYGAKPMVSLPNEQDFLPAASIKDQIRSKRSEEERDQEEQKAWERELKKLEEREFEEQRREAENYLRRREREEYERMHRRGDDDRERSKRQYDDHLRHGTGAAVAAAGLGAAAYAARIGNDKRDKDRDERDLRYSRDTRDKDLNSPTARDRDIREASSLASRDGARGQFRDSSRQAPRPREAERDDTIRDDRPRRRDSDEDQPPRRSSPPHDGIERAHEDVDSPPISRHVTRSINPERSMVNGNDTREGETMAAAARKDKIRQEDDDAQEDYNCRVAQAQRELSSLTIPDSSHAPSASSSRQNSLDDSMYDASTGLKKKHDSPTEVGSVTLSNAATFVSPTIGNGNLSNSTLALVPAGSSRSSTQQVVEPPREEFAAPQLKGILRKPTTKFPEHKDIVREGVAPLKEDAARKGIPADAKWTRIDRRLVNPEALIATKERYEERADCVIVLRVLTKSEIQKLAEKTKEIRERRDRD